MADIKVVAGDGSLILGADELVAAFAAQFRGPGFVPYVRTPETVELDADQARAAEHGRWTGSGQSGTYLACWRKVTGQWVLESELFVTLA